MYAGLVSVAIVLTTNWLALIPWRRAKGQHWTERARVYHPVRAAAASNLWVLPIVLTLAVISLWPNEAPHWAFVALVTAMGAVAGTLPMDREVFPRIPLRDLLYLAAVSWLIRFLMWLVLLGAVTLMPDAFGIETLVIAGAVLTLCVLWDRDGWIHVGRKVGLFLPAPERLQRIVRDTAARMGVAYREVHVMRAPLAQAYAMPGSRRLVFTERFLQLLSDDAIAAICSHELAHLTEARSDYFKRHIAWLMFLPWILLKPMVHAFGMMGFLLLLFTTALAPVLFRRVSSKLETRADDIARSNEPDLGAYARALAQLYEDSLVPAVHAKQHATHPHLYDRLLAAGATPDYPRPVAADSMSWHGVLFAAALGILAAIHVIHLTARS